MDIPAESFQMAEGWEHTAHTQKKPRWEQMFKFGKENVEEDFSCSLPAPEEGYSGDRGNS